MKMFRRTILLILLVLAGCKDSEPPAVGVFAFCRSATELRPYVDMYSTKKNGIFLRLFNEAASIQEFKVSNVVGSDEKPLTEKIVEAIRSQIQQNGPVNRTPMIIQAVNSDGENLILSLGMQNTLTFKGPDITMDCALPAED